MNLHSRAAFTLWEILVLLCLILVVAAIFFPLFQPHTSNRHRASCQSELKQFGVAFAQYSQDSDEKLPPGVNTLNNGWAGQIYPYVKSIDVYHCPDDPEAGSYISYAENQTIAGQSLAKFTAPSYSAALYEATTLNCDPSKPETVSGIGLLAPPNSTRHDPAKFGLNFLAVDGHVKWFLPAEVSGGLRAVSPKQAADKGYLLTFAVK